MGSGARIATDLAVRSIWLCLWYSMMLKASTVTVQFEFIRWLVMKLLGHVSSCFIDQLSRYSFILEANRHSVLPTYMLSHAVH